MNNLSNKELVILNDEALNIIVDILLELDKNGGTCNEPATNTSEAA